jgi:putative endonuclease
LRDRIYYVYLIASRSRVLYTGVTSDLARRVREHRLGEREGFTKTYRVHRLVFFERFHDPRSAIAREKQIKAWRREKKVALIEAANPTWEDLAAEWADCEMGNEKQILRRSLPVAGSG